MTADRPEPHEPPTDGVVPVLRRAARLRVNRGTVMAGLLVALLGFAIAVQVRQAGDQGLDSLRQSDLVRILDDVGDRRDRLAAEASELQSQRTELSDDAGSQAAIEAARERLDALSVLAGTAPAQGPGVQVFVTDPQGAVTAARVLDLVQELRDAGAEAIQVGSVRVVASTAFTDADGGVAVDGTVVPAPFTVLAIGDSQTMATALEIPGGVLASLPEGARGSVAAKDDVEVTALHPLKTPRYARPAPAPTPGS
ncbi:DUF881 domain-containing protein [Angustibacter aerolatus]